MWVHLIAFLVLFTTHLSDLFINSFEFVKEKEKEKIEKEKQNKVQPSVVALSDLSKTSIVTSGDKSDEDVEFKSGKLQGRKLEEIFVASIILKLLKGGCMSIKKSESRAGKVFKVLCDAFFVKDLQLLPLLTLCGYGAAVLNTVSISVQCTEIKELQLPMWYWLKIE